MNKRTISSLILGATIALAASSATAAANTIPSITMSWNPEVALVNALIGGNDDFTLVSASYTGAHTLYLNGILPDGRVTMSNGLAFHHTVAGKPNKTHPENGTDAYKTYQTYYPNGVYENRGKNADLADIAGVVDWRTFDTVLLTFTFTVAPGVTGIETSFIFATDETARSLNLHNNDVFAFWVDGVNAAFLPNGEAVTVYNARDGGYLNDGTDYGYHSRTDEIQIKADLDLTRTEHTITIAIADVFNGTDYSLAGWLIWPDAAWYDSGVFFGPITAVPEPETWAMLLAGLGLVGVTAKRRRQK